jgi:hypothetical protein
LPQSVNRRRELADVAVLPAEQHQNVHEMEDGQISEVLFAEVPILREAFGVSLRTVVWIIVSFRRICRFLAFAPLSSLRGHSHSAATDPCLALPALRSRG